MCIRQGWLWFFAVAVFVIARTNAAVQGNHCVTKTSNNYGRKFYLALTVNYGVTSDPVVLKVLSKSLGIIVITSPGAGINDTYTLSPTVTVISLNGSNIRSNALGKSNKGIILRSSVDVSVFVYEGTSDDGIGDAFVLSPVTEIKTTFPARYVVQSYEPNQREHRRSQFIIVATEDNTNLNVSFRMAGGLFYNGTQYFNGSALMFTLNYLQTFHAYHRHDLSGTIINSMKPVAIFSGDGCADIPSGTSNGCDMIWSQLIPVQFWETAFIIPPIYKNHDYYVRIFAYHDDTTVVFSGPKNVSEALQRSDFVDINIRGEMAAVLTSNKAVSIILLNTVYNLNGLNGGPFLLSVPGVSQLSSPPFVFPSDKQHDPDEYVTVIIDKQFKRDLLYNSRPMQILQEYSVPYPFEKYIVVVARLTNETYHTISMTNNSLTSLGVFVYGRAMSEAYGFVAGMNLNTNACISSGSTQIPTKPITSATSTILRPISSSSASKTPLTSFTTSLQPAVISSFGPNRMRCFACSDIEHLRFCDKVQLCQEREVCYVSSKIARDGQVVFSSGCSDQQTCLYVSNRRSIAVGDTCLKCCSTEFCNTNGCNDEGFLPVRERGPLCFDCDNFSHPSNCHRIALCGKYEQCSIEEYRWNGFENVYKMGCMASANCQHDSGHQYRSVPVCRTCCSTDFCNLNCTHNQYTAPIVG